MVPDSRSRRIPLAPLIALLLLPGLGCAGVSFHHERIGMEPPTRVVQSIRPGQIDLHTCLAKLGAPTQVERSEDGERFVLTWSWEEQEDWGFFLALPLGDASPSLNWADEARQPHYVRLFFDRNWQLVDMALG